MSLHFRIFWVHFFHVPFFDLIHWFWPKTTWEAHPSGFLGPKRCILDFSKKKSEKSPFFSEKMKMDQKWSKNPEKVRNLFQAWFPIIFIIWTHQIEIFGIFGRFAPFLVIFGDLRAGPILGGRVCVKCHFLASMWKLSVGSTPGCPQLIRKRVRHTP